MIPIETFKKLKREEAIRGVQLGAEELMIPILALKWFLPKELMIPIKTFTKFVPQ
jgi:hypothetical protein